VCHHTKSFFEKQDAALSVFAFVAESASSNAQMSLCERAFDRRPLEHREQF
jgi:hypothetical protein